MSGSGWILVMISAALAVLANLLLRAGVDRAGGFGDDMSAIHLALLNLCKQPFFDIGIILYAITTLVWIRILATEPLSVAYPVLVSITFLLVTIGGTIIFRETLNAYKIFGLLVIITGIIIVSRS